MCRVCDDLVKEKKKQLNGLERSKLERENEDHGRLYSNLLKDFKKELCSGFIGQVKDTDI